MMPILTMFAPFLVQAVAALEPCAFKRTPWSAHPVNDRNLVAVLQIPADSFKRMNGCDAMPRKFAAWTDTR